MADSDSRNIHQRLLAVRQQVTGLSKDGQSNFGERFKYVSSNNILGQLRPLLDAEGVMLEVRIVAHRMVHKWEAGMGERKEHLTELDVEFVWVNVDNPQDRIVSPWYGQGLDTGEKGVGKALTYAEKYFLLKQFSIPTDEDDPDRGHADADNGNGNGRQQAKRQQAAPAPVPAPAAAPKSTAPPGENSIIDVPTFRAAMCAIKAGSDEIIAKAQGKADPAFTGVALEDLKVSDLRKIYMVTLAAKSKPKEAAA